MYDINSIDELVTELGGPSVLGALLGISQEAVSNWIVRKSIPGGWHMELAAMLTRKGLTVDPEKVFGIPPEKVEGLLPGPLEAEAAA